MTLKLSVEEFTALGAPHMVYVRPVKAAQVLASAPIEDLSGWQVDPEQILYAVHGANGACLAILGDRDSAVAAALAHEMAPVSVH
ncbi:MAG: hypothetical protein RJA87_1796 [Pseudomonadota bacterium]